MTPQVKGFGPSKATIAIVSDAPSQGDYTALKLFAGTSGDELAKLLHEAGILLSDCYITSVMKQPVRVDNLLSTKKKGIKEKNLSCTSGSVYYHPDLAAAGFDLGVELQAVAPTVVVVLGPLGLFTLTGNTSISKWRGSLLESLAFGFKIIPTYSPDSIRKQWELRPIAVHDLRNAYMESLTKEVNSPAYNFLLRPSYEAVMMHLDELLIRADLKPLRLSVDIETRLGHIACIGLAWTKVDAICIPLMCVENPEGYWDLEQETQIVFLLRKILHHPNVEVIGQNFMYDAQHLAVHWGIRSRVGFDTMLAQHLMFPSVQKGLDFLASMYCSHYVYWKDESKTWDPKTTSEEQLWIYNCKDCVYTYEIAETEDGLLKHFKLTEQYQFQLRLWQAVLQMIIRGCRIDLKHRSILAMQLMDEMAKREQWLHEVFNGPLNVRSSKQMQDMFYNQLQIAPVLNRKTRQPSCDDDALQTIAKREPLLKPVVERIGEFRTMGALLSNTVNAALDPDGRLRSEFKVAGPETFRFASSETALNTGCNLQNVTSGNEDNPKIQAKLAAGEKVMLIPNIRKLIIPDPGYTLFDCDLDRADLQVVVWEANDDVLKQMLHEGVDIHEANAKDLGISRQLAKSWVHGTNYGGGEKTMATTCGITVKQAGYMRKRWFEIHPGIKDWHDRIESQLLSTRTVHNAFGYRRIYFDRIEGVLPQALAWIPQSTVALVINKGLVNVHENLPEAQLLIQVHDSLVGQILTSNWHPVKRKLQKELLITVPYPDPLIIPVGLKSSLKSWGHVKEEPWDS